MAELRRFYLLLSVLLAVLATIGFWPQYFGPLVTGTVDSLPIIHFHASVYVIWLVLFILQCALVAFGKVALHRQVGRFGLIWGFVVIAVGLTVTFVRFSDRLDAGGIEQAQNFGLWPLLDMVIFATFFGAAVAYRQKPELHKRLMIVAATSILLASVGRFMEFDPASIGSHSAVLALWLSPILLAMAYDIFRQGVVHPAFIAGIAVMGVSSFREPLRFTDTWVGFTHWLASVIV
jgi:hypothetical protein